MTMQASTGAAGRTLVTIARASELLTAAGDKITPPNVSRYVDRFKESIWSEKRGRKRLVDLIELMEHRKQNVRVADKQISRGIDPQPGTIPPVAVAAPPLSAIAYEADDPPADAGQDAAARGVGALNLALKELELRKRTREEALADGSVIEAGEVLELISTTLGVMVTSFEQQEPIIAQRFGREIAAAFRKCRKDAQIQAAKTLADLAQQKLNPTVSAAAQGAAEIEKEDVPESPAD